jgi:hypothetical protein
LRQLFGRDLRLKMPGPGFLDPKRHGVGQVTLEKLERHDRLCAQHVHAVGFGDG